jgi:hypothetical protein
VLRPIVAERVQRALEQLALGRPLRRGEADVDEA